MRSSPLDALALFSTNEPIIKYLNQTDIGTYADFESKTEADFYENGRKSLEEAYRAPVHLLLYEWMSFNLPSSVYTPDFAAILNNGRIVFIEVKASKKQRHYLIGRYKMRIVSSLNPFFDFCIATPVAKTKNALWDIDKIPSDRRLGAYLIRMAMKGENND